MSGTESEVLMAPSPPTAPQPDIAEVQRIALIRDAIIVLEAGLETMVARIGRPIFIPEPSVQRFEYPGQDARVLQVLKCVRIVSGLNAAVVLLRSGYTTEVGVLFRTIDDAIDEIVFVQDGVENAETSDHRRFVEQFFTFETRTGEEMVADTTQRSQVPRRRIQAAQGRILNPENPHRMRQLARAVDNVYSGFVHNSYQSAMELYEGSTERFRVRGMWDTPRIPVYRKELANYTHRALNTLSEVAFHLGLTDVFQRLRGTRQALEVSPAYETPVP